MTDVQRPLDPEGFDSKDEYMAACVASLMDEGEAHEQAAAICNAVWEDRAGGQAMSRYSRHFEIDRSQVNVEQGTFRAVVFTDGEASDGHILNIPGGQVPAKIPLFVNHSADPRTQLGSLHLDSVSAHQVVMKGEVFLGGEGPEAEIRRDLLAKMAAGHVSRMSGRWDAEDEHVQRRTELPDDHPAHIPAKKAMKDSRKRWGLFFDKWSAMEGSIVGLGADPKATLRFAEDEEATPAVRAFWRSVAETKTEASSEPDLEPQTESEESAEDAGPLLERIDDVEALTGTAETVTDPPKSEPHAPEPPTEEALRAAFAAQVREMREKGLHLDDLQEEIEALRPAEEPTTAELLERIAALEGKLSSLSEGRDDGTSPMPVLRSVRDMFDYLDQRMREGEERALAVAQASINAKRGKVMEGQTPKQRLQAEAQALLVEIRRQREESQGGKPPDLGPLVSRLCDQLERARKRAQKTMEIADARLSLGRETPALE